MPRPPLPIPLAAFGIKIEEVSDAWLELRCCGGVTFVPVRTMRLGATLGGVLTRLRCRSCGQSPRSIALVDSPSQASVDQTKGWSGWRVELTRHDRTGRPDA